MTHKRQTVTCRKCGSRRLKVTRQRPQADGSFLRLRKCSDCGRKFITRERIERETLKSYLVT